MTVRIKEGDKNETGGTGIEITDNKVVNLILRSLNNLIKINANNEVYTDLQLDNNLLSTDTLPVGVTVGRVLQANGRPTTGTLISAKTTSGNLITLLYGDNTRLYIDSGTGTRKEFYQKPEVDTLITNLSNSISEVGFSGSYEDLSDTPGVCEITVQIVDANYIGTATKIGDLVDGATIIGHSNGLQGLQGLSIAGVSYAVVNGIDALDNWTHFYGIYKEGYGVIIYSFNNN